MIDIIFLGFFLVLSLVLLIVGFMRMQFGLVIFAGIILWLVAGFLLNGVSYRSGINVTDVNSSVRVVSDNYTVYNDATWKPAFSFTLFLLGGGLIYIGWSGFFNKGKQGDADEE